MMHVPGEGENETRALDEPLRTDLTTEEADPDSEVGSDPAAGPDAIDAVGIHGPPRPGQVFFGRYLVDRQIGEGGMGTVWLVRHLELDAPRALKLIVSSHAFDPQMRARFRREARAMARLTHPNAVAVHDARIGRDAAFIEMEYVRGESLNKLISPGVPMPLDLIARIVEQLCDVLQEAHDKKIVHRDLKPSNLMLVADRPPGKELLKVLDFGIAKILEAEPEVTDVQTGTGCFLGSAPWSSPEQAGGSEIDGRSDLYSVGIILYELLTGSRPFHGPLVRQIYDHLHTPPPRFAAINPSVAVPPAVEQVVLRCLAKNPADRPRSARDLAAEFLWAVTDENSTASRADPLPPAPAGDPAKTQPILDNSVADAAVLMTYNPSALEATEPQPATGPQTPQLNNRGRQPTWSQADASLSTLDAAHRDGRAPGPSTMTSREKSETRARPRGRWWIVLSMALLTSGLVAVALIIRSARNSAPTPPQGYQAQGRVDGAPWPLMLIRNSDQTRFVRIPGGPFTMGNHFDGSGKQTDEDQPAHPVLLSDYYLQENEVTNSEMDAYFLAKKVDRSARPRRFQEAWEQIEKAGRPPGPYPAVGVSHALAEEYARSVGGKLPTEAQWEYAARSRGKPNRYVWDDDEKPSHRNANIASAGDHLYLTTSEVRTFPKDKTEQGVYDLTGNVREWCRDLWARYRSAKDPVRDPKGPDSSNADPLDFVIRGGSFFTFADQFRTTRPRRVERDNPDDHTAMQLAGDQTADDLGFRVVIEWPRNP